MLQLLESAQVSQLLLNGTMPGTGPACCDLLEGTHRNAAGGIMVAALASGRITS